MTPTSIWLAFDNIFTCMHESWLSTDQGEDLYRQLTCGPFITSRKYWYVLNLSRFLFLHSVGGRHMSIITDSRTCTKSTKFCLSDGLPPLTDGYSQSRSRPSKLYLRRKAKVDSIKRFRFAADDTISENSSLAAFQPPTAIKVFNWGFCCLSPLTFAYLSTTKMKISIIKNIKKYSLYWSL